MSGGSDVIGHTLPSAAGISRGLAELARLPLFKRANLSEGGVAGLRVTILYLTSGAE